MTGDIKVNRPLSSMRLLLWVRDRNLRSFVPEAKVRREAITLSQTRHEKRLELLFGLDL